MLLNFLKPPPPWCKSPPLGQGLLLTLHDHTHDTPHKVELLWASDQPNARTSPWQHTSQNTAIRTRSPSNWAAADPRLRPRGHWIQIPVNLLNYRYFYFRYSLFKYNVKLEIPCHSKYSGIISWPILFKKKFLTKDGVMMKHESSEIRIKKFVQLRRPQQVSIACARCNDEMLTVKRSEIMSLQYKFQTENPGIELESPGLQDQETVKLKAHWAS